MSSRKVAPGGVIDGFASDKARSCSLSSGEPALLTVRLEQGDEVCSSLCTAISKAGLYGAAVVSAVGSLTNVEYALPGIREDGSRGYIGVSRVSGPSSIVSLSGHFGRDAASNIRHHLHVSFALEDGHMLGGHLFSGTVFITAEITVIALSDVGATPGIEVDGRQAWMLTPADG